MLFFVFRCLLFVALLFVVCLVFGLCFVGGLLVSLVVRCLVSLLDACVLWFAVCSFGVRGMWFV